MFLLSKSDYMLFLKHPAWLWLKKHDKTKIPVVDDAEVLEKAEAGKKYCEAATKFNTVNRGKPWKYVLLPHRIVSPSMGFKQLCE